MDDSLKAITVQVREVYGMEKVYPLSEEAHIFCEMLNQKTLTEDNIKLIKKLGYKVLVEPNYPRQL